MSTFSCVCGSDNFEVEEIKEKRFYRSKEIDIFFKKYTCEKCGESFFFEDKLDIVAAKEKEIDKEIDDEYRKRDIITMSPKKIRSIRKKLGKTQKEMGRLFGKGDVAFSRYERGEVNAPTELCMLLLLLDKNTITLDNIGDTSNESAKVVKVKVESVKKVIPVKVLHSMTSIETESLRIAKKTTASRSKGSSVEPERKHPAGVYA